MHIDIPKYFYIFCFNPEYFDAIEKDNLINSIKNDCIRWSENLLLQGIDSKSIRDLAGLTTPHYFYEIHEIFISLLDDFQIKIPTTKEIHLQYALLLCQETLKNNISIDLSLEALHKMALEDIIFDDLNIFYLLYHAKNTLKNSNVQFYLEEVDSNNIEAYTIEAYETWIARFSLMLS